MHRVEQHYRERMRPAAHLLRIITKHRRDEAFKHATAWMIKMETALEFLAEHENELTQAMNSADRQFAMRKAIRNIESIRSFIKDMEQAENKPAYLAAALLSADQAFEKRILELVDLLDREFFPKPPEAKPRGWLALLGRFFASIREEANRHVDWRTGPPPDDYEFRKQLRKIIEEHHLDGSRDEDAS